MKIFKYLFVVFFIFVTGLFIYFTPYFFINSIFKSVNDNKNFMIYVNEELIEYNIFLRYQREIFSDINMDSLMPEQLQKKQVMEDSIKYGVDLLIEEENLRYLFKSIQDGKTEADTQVKYSFDYYDTNTFILNILIDGNKQQLVFKRKNIIMWELQDIIFETDINIFND